MRTTRRTDVGVVDTYTYTVFDWVENVDELVKEIRNEPEFLQITAENGRRAVVVTDEARGVWTVLRHSEKVVDRTFHYSPHDAARSLLLWLYQGLET